jgi:ribosome biogenesis GTPase / thiamine phosphate phosphatase
MNTLAVPVERSFFTNKIGPTRPRGVLSAAFFIAEFSLTYLTGEISLNINNINLPDKLIDYGWNQYFEDNFNKLAIPGSAPARIISESRGLFQVFCRYGELSARISGKLRFTAGEEILYPAVGDWVALKPLTGEQKGIIEAVLPRQSKFSRKAAGNRVEEQIVSANVDTIFIVSGLDGGRSLNLRRLERYLTLAWNSGAAPVIVLNKADLCDDAATQISNIESIAPGISIHAVSARQGTGLDLLKSYLVRGKTAAFLGSSGVGKSALINAFLGEEKLQTGEVREDDHAGRHTTTRRQLFLLPDGGAVIDTPGMREIQLWGGEDDLQGAFQDIETLADQCPFSDCSPNQESGCAVKAAIERGELDASRLESYRKLQNELKYLASRENSSARLYERQKWKPIAKLVKGLNKKERFH